MIASGSVIAQHKRLGVPMGGYSTIPDHRPPQSQIHQNWSKERFIREANLIGIHTTKVIGQAFENVKHKEQGYKTAVSILKFAELYAVERLEYTNRKNNTVHRTIKKVKISDSRARLSELLSDPEREINLSIIEQLKINQYIRYRKNVIRLGAAGSGKSFLRNALGIHVCEVGYTVKYVCMIDLLSNL